MWQKIKAAWGSLFRQPSWPALVYAFRVFFPIHYWHDNIAAHPPINTLMWHVHHEFLAERLRDYFVVGNENRALQGRLAYIRHAKPKDGEQPWQIHRRLSLIDIVRNPPARFSELEAAYETARIQADSWRRERLAEAPDEEARATLASSANNWWNHPDYSAMQDTLHEAMVALAAYEGGEEMEALHRSEHPRCPWNGVSIFPPGTRNPYSSPF